MISCPFEMSFSSLSSLLSFENWSPSHSEKFNFRKFLNCLKIQKSRPSFCLILVFFFLLSQKIRISITSIVPTFSTTSRFIPLAIQGRKRRNRIHVFLRKSTPLVIQRYPTVSKHPSIRQYPTSRDLSTSDSELIQRRLQLQQLQLLQLPSDQSVNQLASQPSIYKMTISWW